VAATRVERRLAAILAADVVGYSWLMERDEDGTLARLKAYRKELVDPLVAGHRGHGDRHVRAPRSRFLPNGLLHLFEHLAAGSDHGAPAAAAVAILRIDLAAAMRSMWE
jgi:class 3 adenylate cyclase